MNDPAMLLTEEVELELRRTAALLDSRYHVGNRVFVDVSLDDIWDLLDATRAELDALRALTPPGPAPEGGRETRCPTCGAPPDPEASDPRDLAGDTGHAEADRVLGRLASADPDFNDCTDAAVLIRRLVAERGPLGAETWKVAALVERQSRVAAEARAIAAETERNEWRNRAAIETGHPEVLHDLRMLDAILDHLGIADSENDPVDAIKRREERIEEAEARALAAEEDVKRLREALENLLRVVAGPDGTLGFEWERKAIDAAKAALAALSPTTKGQSVEKPDGK